MSNNKIKILIADANVTTSKKLASYLEDSGFEVACLHEGIHVTQKFFEFRPQFILIDMVLPGFSGYDCLQFLKEQGALDSGETKMIMLSQHNARQNVETCLKMGASDYIVKPVNPMDVLTRIALHIQARKRLLRINEIAEDDIRQINYYLQLVELFIKAIGVQEDEHKVQFQILRMLAMAIGAVRTSLIQIAPEPTVTASSDNESFKSFKLQIEKYPEVDFVQRTGKPLFIESLKDNQMMSFIKDQMKAVHFNSMIIHPVFINGELTGIISSRLTESSKVTDADIRLCQIAAQLIGSYLYQVSQRNSSKPAA